MSELADPRRRHTLDERHLTGVDAEVAQEREVSGARLPEVESRPGDDHLGPDAEQVLPGEVGRLERRDLRAELDDEHILDAGSLEQLEPPLEGRQELDPLAEHGPRVRVEGDDRRSESTARPASTAARTTAR